MRSGLVWTSLPRHPRIDEQMNLSHTVMLVQRQTQIRPIWTYLKTEFGWQWLACSFTFLFFTGTSCYASTNFMLSVDGKTVNYHITNFISAICFMFYWSSFSVKNVLNYFIIIIINFFKILCLKTIVVDYKIMFKGVSSWSILRGAQKLKQLSVNPRVLTLIADLADQDWRGLWWTVTSGLWYSVWNGVHKGSHNYTFDNQLISLLFFWLILDWLVP